MRRPPSLWWWRVWAAATLALAARPATTARQSSALHVRPLDYSPLHAHAHAHAQQWREIGPRTRVFALGAHFDAAAATVTVTALTPRHGKPAVFCAPAAAGRPPPAYAAAAVGGVIDGSVLEYDASIITCATTATAVDAVHLCVGACTSVEPGHFAMPVHTVHRARRPPVFLGACMRMFSDPSSYDTTVDDVVRFLEFHRLVGVDHFTVYALDTTSAAIRCALRSYEREGAVAVIHTNLPVAVDAVLQRGQIATVNDCVHRNKGRYKAFLHADFDEFVVPREHDALVPFIQHQLLNRSVSQIGLRSAFFFRGANESMLASTEREDTVFPFKGRSKYIAVTEDVGVASVHDVLTFARGGGTVVADPAHFLLHHYRKVRKCGATVCADGTSTSGHALAAAAVRDGAMDRFAAPVERAVARRYELMQRHEGGCLAE